MPSAQVAAGTPPVAGAARSSQPKRLVLILGALSAFGPLSIDMYLPALPSLSRTFATGASQVQFTLSACLLGLAAGQMVAGPLSDTLGRRRPLLCGVAAYAVASLLCMITPSLLALILLRFVQGFAGAAGIVISRAIVRDLHSGVAAARFFSLLMLVNGLAPILAPIIGGQLLRVTDWHGVFFVLAITGVLLFCGAALGLGETLPPERRQQGGIGATLATFGMLLMDRSFVGYALSCGLAFAGMFTYISGSPFVLEGIFGVSPQLFSLFFATNALGLMVCGQVNGRLVGRVPLRTLLLIGLAATAGGGVALLLVVLGGVGLAGVQPSLFLVVASLGLVMPNATALALANHPRTAGSASALIGVLQFAIGAVAAPFAGVGGTSTALPMALVIAALSSSALLAYLVLARKGSRPLAAIASEQ
jgi:DHA1 family bicyclomycin/chloramphenicol resistance-like MFS transporter